jgi:hypothetical protein
MSPGFAKICLSTMATIRPRIGFLFQVFGSLSTDEMHCIGID